MLLTLGLLVGTRSVLESASTREEEDATLHVVVVFEWIVRPR